MTTKSKSLQTLHSSATPEHGTPLDYIAAARTVLGRIDLDPASSEVFNQNVKATRYFTKEDNCLSLDWQRPDGGASTVLQNSPSGNGGRLVKACWKKLLEECYAGRVQCAIYIGFSIDQLQTLQLPNFACPLDFPICVPSSRMKFIKSLEEPLQSDMFSEAADPSPVLGKSPTKPNFVCYLPPFGDLKHPSVETFRAEFEKFGVVRL